VALGEDALPEKQLDRTFEMWWPELEQALARIQNENRLPEPRRSEREILEELLGLVREQSRQVFYIQGDTFIGAGERVQGLRLGGRRISAPLRYEVEAHKVELIDGTTDSAEKEEDPNEGKG